MKSSAAGGGISETLSARSPPENQIQIQFKF